MNSDSLRKTESLLGQISRDVRLGEDTTQKAQIDTSLNKLMTHLTSHFGNGLLELRPFGSYARQTALIRDFDPYADVDLLVVFDTSKKEHLSDTYLRHLKQFCEVYYKTSRFIRDHPTVKLSLNHIDFDLVPSIKKPAYFYGSSEYMVPEVGNTWQKTEPDDVTSAVSQAVRSNAFIVRPVMRLLKAWNARSGYFMPSYRLEKHIVERVSFASATHWSAFKAGVNSINVWKRHEFTEHGRRRMDATLTSIQWIETHIDREDWPKAENRIKGLFNH